MPLDDLSPSQRKRIDAAANVCTPLQDVLRHAVNEGVDCAELATRLCGHLADATLCSAEMVREEKLLVASLKEPSLN